jgi:hypothetical protein
VLFVLAGKGGTLIIAIGIMRSWLPTVLTYRREQNEANRVRVGLYSSSEARSRHFGVVGIFL